jgi:hypothetical protein
MRCLPGALGYPNLHRYIAILGCGSNTLVAAAAEVAKLGLVSGRLALSSTANIPSPLQHE